MYHLARNLYERNCGTKTAKRFRQKYVTSQRLLTSECSFGFAGFVTFVHCEEGGQRLAQIPPLK